MNAHMHEHTARAQDPGCLAQHRWVAGHVGVGHHRDDSRNAAIRGRQILGIGTRDGQAAAGVPQHPCGQVDACRGPAQLRNLGGARAGAAADLQANAAALAEAVLAAPIRRVGARSLKPAPSLSEFAVGNPVALRSRLVNTGRLGSPGWRAGPVIAR